jgi:hypothetical protein
MARMQAADEAQQKRKPHIRRIRRTNISRASLTQNKGLTAQFPSSRVPDVGEFRSSRAKRHNSRLVRLEEERPPFLHFHTPFVSSPTVNLSRQFITESWSRKMSTYNRPRQVRAKLLSWPHHKLPSIAVNIRTSRGLKSLRSLQQ